jgi:thiamine-monophosphate kinase
MPRRHPTEGSLLARIERVFPGKATQKRSAAQRNTVDQLTLGIGDDAALFRPARGCETILTCDWFLEGTHFLRDKHPANAVGWKSLARAVSDIAAMGGTPRCFLLSLALPESATGRWLTEFLRGLRRASQRFDCLLAGGDTTSRDQILINLTVIGEVQRGRALRRDGARGGDLLFVSGRLGEAERGLHLLRKQPRMATHWNSHRSSKNRRLENPDDAALRKHLYPEPRLALGQWLVKNRFATAAMDISDGLSSDLSRLCKASGVGAHIDAGKLPVVNLATRTRNPLVPSNLVPSNVPSNLPSKKVPIDDPLALALHGGDDYELLFTVPPKKARQIPVSFAGVPLLSIGEIIADRKILLVGEKHPPITLEPGGWDPFR